jgi:hypothetical protein
MVDAAEKAQIVSRLERIQALMKDLDRMAATAADRQRVRDRMSRELEAAKEAVRLLGMTDRS